MTDHFDESVDRRHSVPEPVTVTTRSRRGPLSLVALVLGVVFLIANIVTVRRFPAVFFSPTVQSAISLLLMIVSVVICLLLIVNAVALRRPGADGAQGNRWNGRVAGVVVLGLLAPLAALASLQVNRAVVERQTPRPCIDVYEQAQAIAKDNPKFRMPAKDRDEIRCTVNAVLGR